MDKMMEKLWGDNYFDAGDKKWKKDENNSSNGKPLVRGFCQFIMAPIISMSRAIMEGNKEQTEKMLKSIGVVIKQEE